MALMNGTVRQEGSRSNTALVKSGHLSPAEKWLLDPTFASKEMSGIFKDGVLFNYQYGGPGMTDVVIPKGRMVGVTKNIKDYVSGKFYTAITLPGLALNKNVIGMAPFNFTKDYEQKDRFGGNQPGIITTEYVTLPYMPGFNPESAYTLQGVMAEEQEISVLNRNPWGAVIGKVENGDYVKATPSGRLCKWDSTKDSPMEVVGQILASDLNFETEGWLKWMLWDAQYKKEDDSAINRSGVSNMPTDNGYPIDPSYAEGNTLFQNYQSQIVSNPTGLTGLHDGSGNYTGFGRNDTVYSDMEVGSIQAGTKAGTAIQVFAVDYAGGKITNIQQNVVVKINGVVVPADKVTVNYQKAIITVTLSEDVAADSTITATYQAMHYGTPSYLDFKGVVGSICVLLAK